jgi:hypothetical protein
VDFNAGVVAAGEAQIESTVTGNDPRFVSSDKESALKDQSQVYLPINNALSSVGYVAFRGLHFCNLYTSFFKRSHFFHRIASFLYSCSCHNSHVGGEIWSRHCKGANLSCRVSMIPSFIFMFCVCLDVQTNPAGFLREIGQGVQHIASRVDDLISFIQRCNDYRKMTGEVRLF